MENPWRHFLVLMKDSITSILKEHSSDSDLPWQVAMATAGNWKLGWYQWTSNQHWSITLPPALSYYTKMRRLLAFSKEVTMYYGIVAYYGSR